MALGPIMATLGLAALRGEVNRRVERAVRKAAFGAATGFFVLLAFGLGLAAFTVWLAGEVGTVPALAIVAGGALGIAVIVQIVAALSDRPPARRPVRQFADIPPLSAAAAAAPPRPEDEPPLGAVAGAMAMVAAAGFLLARQFFGPRKPS